MTDSLYQYYVKLCPLSQVYLTITLWELALLPFSSNLFFVIILTDLIIFVTGMNQEHLNTRLLPSTWAVTMTYVMYYVCSHGKLQCCSRWHSYKGSDACSWSWCRIFTLSPRSGSSFGHNTNHCSALPVQGYSQAGKNLIPILGFCSIHPHNNIHTSGNTPRYHVSHLHKHRYYNTNTWLSHNNKGWIWMHLLKKFIFTCIKMHPDYMPTSLAHWYTLDFVYLKYLTNSVPVDPEGSSLLILKPASEYDPESVPSTYQPQYLFFKDSSLCYTSMSLIFFPRSFPLKILQYPV